MTSTSRLPPWVSLAVCGVLTLVAFCITGCHRDLRTWSGDWRSPTGALIVLSQNEQLASAAFTGDASLTGHFLPTDDRHASIDWLVFPTIETAGLGATSTLRRTSKDEFLLESTVETSTYTVCVFPSETASAASIGALERALRADPAVVDLKFLSKDDVLILYKKASERWPDGLIYQLEGNPLRACVVVSVRMGEPTDAFVRRARAIPEVQATASALDGTGARVIPGPHGRQVVRFHRSNQ